MTILGLSFMLLFALMQWKIVEKINSLTNILIPSGHKIYQSEIDWSQFLLSALGQRLLILCLHFRQGLVLATGLCRGLMILHCGMQYPPGD